MATILKIVSLTCLAAFAGIPTAWAIMPATPEQMFCGGQYVFVGRVLSAINTDRRLSASAQSCGSASKNTIKLQIVVTRLLGAKATAQGLKVGQTITARSQAHAGPYNTEKYNWQGGLAFRAPYDALLPNEWLHAAYVGQVFIFSGDATHVIAWPRDKAQWAKETMVQRNKMSDTNACATPL